MAIFAKTFSGEKQYDSANSAMDIIRGAIKLLYSDASVTSEPYGVKVSVTVGRNDNPDMNLRKILEGLGFEYESEEKPEIKTEAEPIPAEAVKITGLAEAAAEGEYHVPSGRYRKDGTDIVYNAAGLTIRLQRQEFGSGIRFFREGDGTKWVVTQDERGFRLAPVKD